MEYIYIIIGKYIYEVSEFSKNYKNINIPDYHLKNATNDLVLKYENDDMFNLFQYVNENKYYLGVHLICENIFKKNIPEYFKHFLTENDKNKYLQNLNHNSFILTYKMDNLFQLIIKINHTLHYIDIIYIHNNWCYYSKKGVYNFIYIEELISFITYNQFEKIINLI
jgi:hypothetical protein